MNDAWVKVEDISFSYGDKKALQGVSFDIKKGDLFCVVGPNGGGKSTTFKILSTLLSPSTGFVEFWGERGDRSLRNIRSRLGVVFQSPALDKKLSVEENLFYHGRLYGLSGAPLREKTRALLERFNLADRAQEKVEKLSGGLKRRVEIAKSLLTDPHLLILDEPTTGLDPVARKEMWDYLNVLRKQTGLTIIFTTHLMDEAETSQRTLFLDQGRVLVSGTPSELKARLGGDVIALRTEDPDLLQSEIEKKFTVKVKRVDEELRIEKSDGAQFIPSLVESFPHQIQSVTLGKPTLEDLFIHLTGHRFDVS